MRVLHLVHVRWWNASAQYAIHLAAAQQRLGHTVAVWTAEGEPPAEHAKKLGLKVLERPMGAMHTLGMGAELRRLAAEFDVINAHHADLQNVALLALGKAKRPTLVRTRVDVRDAKPSAVNRYLYNNRLDAIIVPGEESRRRYIDNLGIREDKVITVYGGVDHERFCPEPAVRARERQRLGLADDDVAFGLVGRLGTIKGPEYYLEAAAAVHAANRKACFIVAGKPASGHTLEEYQAVAKRFGDEGVRFLGYVDDVAALLSALDCGVITSVGSEAHCRVGLEMMSSGLPVVGTDIGVIPEVVSDQETGYIVRSRNAQELAAALGRLASDSALRHRLGNQARQRVETEFTFSRWVHRTMNVYRNAEQARWT
jgi:glycosyltransferase involved in cell wall biosynthesis